MYMGVDGGGTSTRGIIEKDDGRLGEVVTSSASNLLVVGQDRAYAAMDDVIDRLNQQGDLSQIEGVIGVAGADRLAVRASWQQYFARRGLKRLWITGDYWLPWANFTKGEDGLIAILGTGSIFLVSIPQNPSFRWVRLEIGGCGVRAVVGTTRNPKSHGILGRHRTIHPSSA